MLPPLVDTHAHLDEVEGLDGALSRARSQNVCAIMAVGQHPESNDRTLEIGEANRGLVYPAIGIHPHFAEQATSDWFGNVEAKAANCVAIGEIGLDFWTQKDGQGRARQVSVYERLLEIAKRLGKPVSVHSRGAWEETVRLARKHDVPKAIFHWFTGPKGVLELIVDAGYAVSASPAVEYSKAHRQAIAEAPLENLVVETDSPVRYRGVEAEPADVAKAVRCVAEMKGLEPFELAGITTRTARSLLGI